MADEAGDLPQQPAEAQSEQQHRGEPAKGKTVHRPQMEQHLAVYHRHQSKQPSGNGDAL